MPIRTKIFVALTILIVSIGYVTKARATEGYDFSKMIQPISKHARLEHADWFTWGASVLRGDDSQYHMFYCRWPKRFPFYDGWVVDAEICYAVASKPEGPFCHVRTMLRGRKHEGQIHAFDGASVYNPHVKAFDGKVYLYYTGNHDPSSDRMIGNRKVAVTHQTIGVLVADSPADLGNGKYRRLDNPILKPLSRIRADIPEDERNGDPNNITPANIVVVNPSVERRADGKYILMFKGWAAGKGRFGPVHGVALGDTPTGPFEVQPDPVLAVPLEDGRLAMAEDPYLWYDKNHQKFYAIVKDFHGQITGAGASMALFESTNGIRWKPSAHCLVCGMQIRYADGTVEKVRHLERPQLLLNDKGQPRTLYAAVKQGDHSFNVHIPLRVVESEPPNPQHCERGVLSCERSCFF